MRLSFHEGCPHAARSFDRPPRRFSVTRTVFEQFENGVTGNLDAGRAKERYRGVGGGGGGGTRGTPLMTSDLYDAANQPRISN